MKQLLKKITYLLIIFIICITCSGLTYYISNRYVDYKTKYVPVVFGNMVCKCVKVKNYYECISDNCIYFEIEPNSEESRENEEIDIKSNIL